MVNKKKWWEYKLRLALISPLSSISSERSIKGGYWTSHLIQLKLISTVSCSTWAFQSQKKWFTTDDLNWMSRVSKMQRLWTTWYQLEMIIKCNRHKFKQIRVHCVFFALNLFHDDINVWKLCALKSNRQTIIGGWVQALYVSI